MQQLTPSSISTTFESIQKNSQYENDKTCSDVLFDYITPICKEQNLKRNYRDINYKHLQCDDYPCDNFSKIDRGIEIHIPYHTSTNRIPGLYDDLNSEDKKKHNSFIIQAAALLNAQEGDITALILDGKKMRTTNALLTLGNLIETIYVIEINPETFQIIKSKTKNNTKVRVYHSHIMDYILRGADEKINIIYLDTMCNFFDSDRSYGTYTVINELLLQLKSERIIFAATFCLRTNTVGLSYENQVEEILNDLERLLESFDYTFTSLLDRSEMRYKGQKITNLGMMFVLYYLTKRKTMRCSQEVVVLI